MRRAAAAVLLLLALAACSSRERPRGDATVTLFGPGARLEPWKTAVIEGVHVHPAQPDLPCLSSAIEAVAGAAGDAMAAGNEKLREPAKDLGRRMGTFMELLVAEGQGPARGGPGRTVLALMRLDAGGSRIQESLLVDLPRLPPGETEKLFRAPDVQAWFERPPKTVEAALERGWVRAVRDGSGTVDYDLFLVLKPAARNPWYESLQVVTRVSWPPPGR